MKKALIVLLGLIISTLVCSCEKVVLMNDIPKESLPFENTDLTKLPEPGALGRNIVAFSVDDTTYVYPYLKPIYDIKSYYSKYFTIGTEYDMHYLGRDLKALCVRLSWDCEGVRLCMPQNQTNCLFQLSQRLNEDRSAVKSTYLYIKKEDVSRTVAYEYNSSKQDRTSTQEYTPSGRTPEVYTIKKLNLNIIENKTGIFAGSFDGVTTNGIRIKGIFDFRPLPPKKDDKK